MHQMQSSDGLFFGDEQAGKRTWPIQSSGPHREQGADDGCGNLSHNVQRPFGQADVARQQGAEGDCRVEVSACMMIEGL